MNRSSGKSVCDIINSLDLTTQKKCRLKKINSLGCNLCTFTGNNKRSLYEHVKSHSTIFCSHCPYKTIWKSHFERHFKLHYEHAPFRCQICKFVTTNLNEFVRHRKSHYEGRPHYCAMCEVTFKRKNQLEEHIRKHTREKPFACPDCRQSFSNESSVVKHQELNRCAKNFLSFNQYKNIPCGLVKVRKYIYGQDKNLINYRRNTAGNVDLVRKETRNEKSQALEILDFAEDTETNVDCADSARGHRDEVPQLEKCVKIHALLPASDLRKLASLEQLKTSHMRKLWDKLKLKERWKMKRYLCSLCGSRFAQHNRLNEHIRTHTGERPLACSLCNFASAHSSDFYRHGRLKHPGEVISKKLKSNEKLSSQLASTETKKTDYFCAFCDEQQATAFELLNHLRQHTGQTLYKCEQAGCVFKIVDQKLYDNHVSTHS